MSTEACHNCKALYFSNICEVKECEQERENYKQIRTVRQEEKESEKETAVLKEALADVLALKPQIAERLPDRGREHRQLMPTLTWVMAPKWSSHKPAARQKQPRKQSA